MTARQKQAAVILLSLSAAYCLFGFLGAPFIVHSMLEGQVADALDRQVTVAAVRVNPLSLSVTLEDLAVRETDGTAFVELDEAYANLQLSSLAKRALVLESVRLVNPRISLVRSDAAVFNFSDIGRQQPDTSVQAGDADDAGGFAVAIYQASVSGGRITLDDQKAAVSHLVSDLEVRVSDFSTRPDDATLTTGFNLSGRINDGEVSLKGRTRLFAPDRDSRAQLVVRALGLPHYLPYVPLPDNLSVHSLTLEVDTEVDFRMVAGNEPALVLAGLLAFSDVRLADGNDDPFVSHPRLTLDLLPSNVLTGQLRLAEVVASSPEIHLKRLPSGALYLPFLAVKAHDRAEAKAAEDPTGGFNPVVTIDALRLDKGVLHYTDASTPTPFVTTVTDLNLAVDNFGLNPDRTAAVRLAMQTDAGESLSVDGTMSLEPLQIAAEMDAAGIPLSRYRPYYQDRFGFTIPDGTLSAGGSVRFHMENGAPSIRLANVRADLRSLKVADDDGDAILDMDRLRISETTAVLDRREVTVGKAELSDARVVCRREKDGSVNLASAFASRSVVATAGDTAAAEGRPSPPSDLADHPFTVNLRALDVSDVSLEVEDRVPAEPFQLRLDDIRLSAANLSTTPDATGRADLSLRWEQGGQIQLGGQVSLFPLALDLDVKLNDLDVRPLQPYLSRQTGLIVTQGFFNSQGRMRISQPADKAPQVDYAGTIGIDRFASIDRKNANDFLKWDALRLDRFEAGVNPARLAIDRIFLSDFFARVIVDEDGGVNLVSMFTEPDEPPSVDEKTVGRKSSATPVGSPVRSDSEKTSIRIARVALSGGTVDFSDRFIQPNFNATFHDLGGRISGLESVERTRADVQLAGMWSNHAPVEVSGRINPLIDDPFVDLNLTISDIELSPFSPYSGKYLGYQVEKGKLTFSVGYLLENRKLEGKNGIFIDQLDLGDSVDSPEAVNLPIELAVALLKDRNGNIDLDLPVSGHMDDPEFKFGTVVMTALRNLIVKIVSSPFAVLGAIAGGGEELSYLAFEPGSSTIVPENAEKMDKLAAILFERPDLKLDVRGTAVPSVDSHALKAISLENQLKGEKLRQRMAEGESAIPLEQISLDAGEQPDLVQAVFAAAGLDRPTDAAGQPVEPAAEAMERKLLAQIEVADDDYRRLAEQRAFNAKSYLLETGHVARERVFIVAPRIDVQGKDGSAQVVFRLK